MTHVFILPSSDPDVYSSEGAAVLVSKIVNPKGIGNVYMEDKRPTWWPADIDFRSPNGYSKQRGTKIRMPVRQLREILAAFFENCPDQYIISPDKEEMEMQVQYPIQMDTSNEPVPQPPVELSDANTIDPIPSSLGQASPAKELLQRFERLLEEVEERALEAERKEAVAQLMLAETRKHVLSLERKLCELAKENDSLQKELLLSASMARC